MTGMSMEEFGPVSVDYFHGRTVEDVFTGSGDPAEGEWGIRFAGGGLVLNYDPAAEKPPAAIKGMALTLTVLGAKETTGGKPSTLLYFGNSQNPKQYVAKLNPLQYAMQDETATRGHLVFAQRSNADMPPEARETEDDGA